MNTSKLLLASLVAAAVGASTQALAASDTTTVDLEAGQYYFDFDDTPGSFIGPNAPYGAADGKVDNTGGSVTLGFHVTDDLAMKLHIFSADASGSNRTAAGGCFGLKTVDGSQAFSNGTCSGIAALAYTTEVSYSGLDVMVGTPIYSSDSQTLSLYGSLNLAELDQSHTFSSLPGVATLNMGDSLETTYAGLGVGLEHVLSLTDHLKLTGNLRLDALQASTDMKAVERLFGTYVASDSEKKIIGRGVAKIGLAWDFGAVSVGVNAFAEYLSEVAAAEHSVTEGINQPSKIGGQDGTIYGYSANVSFAF